MDLEAALDLAIRLAREAGAHLLAEFHRPGGPRGDRKKSPADREAEVRIREAIRTAFPDHGFRAEEDPAENLLPRDPDGSIWLVDPNDGTAAAHDGWRGASVSIALLARRRPVLGVVFAYAAPDDRGDLIAWAQGRGPIVRSGRPVVRPSWSSDLRADHTVLVSHVADRLSLANATRAAPARFAPTPSLAWRLARAACGDAEGVVSIATPQEHDLAAGHALVIAAGGVLVDETGREVAYDEAGKIRVQRVFAGSPAVARALAGRGWEALLSEPRPAPEPRDLVWPSPDTHVRDAGRLSRAQGTLLGQLAGDALGSLVEFESPESIAGRYPDGVRRIEDGGTWDTIAGQPTDDSELALALARSLVDAGRFDDEAVARAYVDWLASQPFDIGSTTRQALQAGAAARGRGEPVADAARRGGNRSSQANGALMRVSPLGIFGCGSAADDVAEWARRDAALTHPNGVCLDASAIFAVAVARAVAAGGTPAEIHAHAVDWGRRARIEETVLRAVEEAASGPPSEMVTQQGWVLKALRNAFHRLLAAPSLEEGVVATVGAGGDTDTNAAIAGALLGAVHGREAIPAQWRDRVLTCRPIRGLAGVRHPRPRIDWPVDALVLAERLAFLAGQR